MQDIKQLITNSKGIVITTHKSPDGDAIGSSLGLYLFLKKINQNVTVIVPDGFPTFLNWMSKVEEIIYFDSNNEKAKDLIQKSDIIFSLDYNSLKRIDEMGDFIAQTNAYK